MRVMCIAAARPNFMKVKPVMDTLEAKGADVVRRQIDSSELPWRVNRSLDSIFRFVVNDINVADHFAFEIDAIPAAAPSTLDARHATATGEIERL